MSVAAIDLVQKLQALEQEAYRLNLFITARSINNAKNALGWEMAGNRTRADMAIRGER